MAAKLEWVHSIEITGDNWKAGKWSISIMATGLFCVEWPGAIKYNFPTLADAKAYCQSQEDAAAPVELPPVGSVWGVPGKPETRRLVGKPRYNLDEKIVRWFGVDDRGLSLPEDWHSWLRESGAVRIDGEAERLAKMQTTAEDSIRIAEEWKKFAKEQEVIKYRARGRVKELEAEVAKLKKRLAAEEEWKHVANDQETERDELRAAKGRLLEALRGIADHDYEACNHNNRPECGEYLRILAREAIAKEEGAKP